MLEYLLEDLNLYCIHIASMCKVIWTFIIINISKTSVMIYTNFNCCWSRDKKSCLHDNSKEPWYNFYAYHHIETVCEYKMWINSLKTQYQSYSQENFPTSKSNDWVLTKDMFLHSPNSFTEKEIQKIQRKQWKLKSLLQKRDKLKPLKCLHAVVETTVQRY